MKVRSFPKRNPPATAGLLHTFSHGEAVGMMASLGAPPWSRYDFIATRSEGRKVYIPNLNQSLTRGSDFHAGGTLRAYVIRNGRFVKWTEAAVTGSRTDLWNTITPSGQYVASTGFYFPLANFNKDAGVYPFRVAAIDSNDRVGPWSAHASYTAPNPILAPTPTGNTTTAFTQVAGEASVTAPTGVTVAAGVTASEVLVTWDAVAGAKGYIVQVCWQENPSVNAEPGAEYLEVAAGTPAIPAGSLILFEKQHLTADSKRATRVWDDNASHPTAGTGRHLSEEWSPYTGGDPAPTGSTSKTYAVVPCATDARIFDDFGMGGSGQAFYPNLIVGKTYRFRARLRATSPVTIDVETSFTNTTITGGSLSVTTAWQDFTGTVTISVEDTSVTARRISLVSRGTGMNLHIDLFEFNEDGVDPEDFPSHLHSTIPEGSAARNHALIKIGKDRCPGGIDLLNVGSRSVGRMSVRRHMRMCQLHSCMPWTQYEWVYSEQEHLDFVAYMAGPASDAGSNEAIALRVAQGQSTPWIDAVAGHRYEFGNEQWNTLSGFRPAPNSMTDLDTGTNYNRAQIASMFSQYLIDVMKTSPYWPAFEAKTRFVLGAWINQPQTLTDMLSVPSQVDEFGYAGYIGGDPGDGTSEGLIAEDNCGASIKAGFNFGAGVTPSNAGLVDYTAEVAEIRNAGKTPAIYEGGPGLIFDSGTASQLIAMEVIKKNRAAGSAYLDLVLFQGQKGFATSNYFNLGRLNGFQSHAQEQHGGRPSPSWMLPYQLHAALGAFTVQAMPTDVPDQLSTAGGATYNAVQAYLATSVANPGNKVLVVINRDIDPSQLDPADTLYSATPGGTYLPTVTLGFQSLPESMSYVANVGGMREHQRYPTGQRLTDAGTFVADPLCVDMDFSWQSASVPESFGTITIDDTYGATPSGLPAGCCVMIQFLTALPVPISALFWGGAALTWGGVAISWS